MRRFLITLAALLLTVALLHDNLAIDLSVLFGLVFLPYLGWRLYLRFQKSWDKDVCIRRTEIVMNLVILVVIGWFAIGYFVFGGNILGSLFGACVFVALYYLLRYRKYDIAEKW